MGPAEFEPLVFLCGLISYYRTSKDLKSLLEAEQSHQLLSNIRNGL